MTTVGELTGRKALVLHCVECRAATVKIAELTQDGYLEVLRRGKDGKHLYRVRLDELMGAVLDFHQTT